MGNKRLAVIYGLLVTWSPIVQWWFAVNGLVEMLILGQLAIVIVERYLKAVNTPNGFYTL